MNQFKIFLCHRTNQDSILNWKVDELDLQNIP
jgi:hypothetical protein